MIIITLQGIALDLINPADYDTVCNCFIKINAMNVIYSSLVLRAIKTKDCKN